MLFTNGGNTSLLAVLNKHSVRCIVIGGLAVKFYASARNADDLDLLVEPTLENAGRLIRALYELGTSPQFSASDLAKPKTLVPLKNHICYADAVTPDTTVDFQKEWDEARLATINGQPARVASKDLLIRMKSGTERTKDLDDIALLSSPQ